VRNLNNEILKQSEFEIDKNKGSSNDLTYLNLTLTNVGIPLAIVLVKIIVEG